jgi:His/Glu/Gln/Arg/opine family amino acid ABC transporter permease subunit
MGIAVPQDSGPLVEQINITLMDMESDGTMERIHQRYFGMAPSVSANSGRMKSSVIAKKLLRGFSITLLIALSSILIGFALAIPAGLLLVHKTNGWLIPHFLVRSFVDFIRGTPVLVQLLFVWLGLGLRPIAAAVLTLGICAMAYMAEAVRSGLMSVDPGQSLAARALGLSALDRFRFIVWPQAFRIAIPPLMNCVIALVKDTALVSIISIPELIREAQSIISVTFEPRTYYLIAGLMFFAVTFPMMKLSGRVENMIKAKGYSSD